jgi:hypothetical protein
MNPPSAFGKIGSFAEHFQCFSFLQRLLPQEGSLRCNFHCLSWAARSSGRCILPRLLGVLPKGLISPTVDSFG